MKEATANFEPFSLELPWPPSMNSYWRAIPMGKIARNILSKAGRTYRERAIASIMESGHHGKGLDGRLGLSLILCAPDKRRRDLDNFLKPVLDALTHGNVYEDDYQVDKLRVVRGPIVPKGIVLVGLRPVGEPVERID